MILFIALVVLIIGLFAEIFRYNKVKANAFSKEEVKKAAAEQVQKIRYKDPVISCDYCGAKVDTSAQKVCPQCGAPYDKDDEWTSRFKVQDSFINASTQEIIAQREEKARIKGDEILKRIKNRIRVLVFLNLALIAIGIFALVVETGVKIRGNDELNESSFDDYIQADYTIEGDGVLIDENGIKVTVEGFYVEEDALEELRDYQHTSVKIAIKIENNTKKNLRVNMDCSSINGITKEVNYIYTYDYFKKNSVTDIYEKLSYVPFSDISEMIFDKIEIRDEDYNVVAESDGPVTITTTADMPENIVDIDTAEQIFTNEKVDIYAVHVFKSEENSTQNGYVFYIVNKTNDTYSFERSDFKLNGIKEINAYGARSATIPAGYTYVSDRAYSYDDDYNDLGDNALTVSFSFSTEEHPENNFSTGYIDIGALCK
ncbi:MAG: zinc ribbon domain-containing protein [Butyrivibrio sp.]|nr:zinc ribbon domain-containing protein [Butyrivibrio sp.]